MTTANDIITLALKSAGVLGVGQTALAEDANDALTFLNMMIAQWQAKRLMIYHLVDLSKQSTGSQVYTIGPSGDFIVAERPTGIESSFIRQQGNGTPVDLPINILQSREDYNRIASKSIGSVASCLWYDPAFPTGNLYFWPVPSSQYELHITVKETLGKFSSLTTIFNLPSEYQEAIHYNLAIRLAVHYSRPSDPRTIALAKLSLNTIANANTSVPELSMPPGLGRGNGGGLLSVYTGL